MFWMIPLAMAAAGAMIDKEKPLRGAALGAAAGMTGGAALGAMGAGAAGAGAAGASGAGGLLGAEAAGAAGSGLLGGAAGTGATQAGMLAAQEAGAGMLGAGNLGWGGATTGAQGALNSALGAEAGASTGGLLGSAGNMVKPVGQAMQTAQMFQPKERQLPQAPQILPPTASPTLSQLVGQNQQTDMERMKQEMERRALQRQRILQMGRGF